MIDKIGFGGGCHWCTEAVFQSLKGVQKVEQGYIASTEVYANLSEGVIVHFDSSIISLLQLIEVHLHTHKATSNHSFRDRYRSAVYWYTIEQQQIFEDALVLLQPEFKNQIITKTLPFAKFTASRVSIQEYYKKNPEAPFCQRYIIPKLNELQKQYASLIKG